MDAAIAVNAALGFLEPVSCGIGGDLFALVWDAKTQRLYGLNASGRAPLALTADKVPPQADGTIPVYSPYAWTVPGAVDGWFELHGRFGRLPMTDVLAPAIGYARDGFPVTEVIADGWQRNVRVLEKSPGFAETFMPGGRAPAKGEVFANPRLARTYEAIARGGRDKQKGPTLSEGRYFPELKEEGKALVRVIGSTPGQDNRIPFIVYVSAMTFAEHSSHDEFLFHP